VILRRLVLLIGSSEIAHTGRRFNQAKLRQSVLPTLPLAPHLGRSSREQAKFIHGLESLDTMTATRPAALDALERDAGLQHRQLAWRQLGKGSSKPIQGEREQAIHALCFITSRH